MFSGLSSLRAQEKQQQEKKPLSDKEKAMHAYLAQQYGAPAPEGVEVKRKRKKKKRAPEAGAGGPGVRIVDQDVSGFKPLEQQRERARGPTGPAAGRMSFEEEEEEEEDKPVIANPEEAERLQQQAVKERQFFAREDDGSGWAAVGGDPEEQAGHRHGDDVSPPRRGRHDSPDASPPRRGRHDSPDASPPRRGRHDSPDASPPRRGRHDSPDASTPRRGRHDSPDASPPRRARHDSPDASPPRRRPAAAAADASPPRRRHDSADASPPRRGGRRGSSDASPPRRGQPPAAAADASPPRRGPQPSLDASPPRKRRGSEPAGSGDGGDADAKRRKMMSDGTTAGMVTGRELMVEMKHKKERERQRFAELDADVTGKGAQTVFRDKEGRAVSKEEYQEQQAAAKKKAQYDDESQLQWGGGLRQKHEAEQRARAMAAEAAKPFARGRDDPELDAMQRGVSRWGDPMAHLAKKRLPELDAAPSLAAAHAGKLKKSGFIIPQEVPAHSWLRRNLGPPINRYGIKPGRHWDGVDRSNGFEREMFKRQNELKRRDAVAFQWAQDDM